MIGYVDMVRMGLGLEGRYGGQGGGVGSWMEARREDGGWGSGCERRCRAHMFVSLKSSIQSNSPQSGTQAETVICIT